jgi:DNA-binding SARP family transcriptional activator
VEFRILGPLEVVHQGRPLALGGARQRALLAILLTRANEVVSTDTLIDELWNAQPPATALNALQFHMSQLRKVLPAGVLETRSPGYVARVEPSQLDLHRFEALVEQAADAAPQEAARALREALALWRGPALADFAYEEFAQAEIARLEELRLAALERRIEADLALGRHAELAGELEALVLRHPLRECLRAQLVFALYRSGRQADALRAYQEARRTLVEELGIEPGPALRRLEQAILVQDPELDVQKPRVELSPERAILVVPAADGALAALLAVAEPLARRPARELILVRLVASSGELERASASLNASRAELLERALAARTVAFTSARPGEDVVRLAAEQDVDLVLLDAPRTVLDEGSLPPQLAAVLEHAPADVAVLVSRERATAIDATRPLLVAFGGADHDWAAVELAAWLAAGSGAPLKLVGAAEDAGRRDASRLLATASLLVQRAVGVATEPLLVPRGGEAVARAAEGGALVVVGLSPRWRAEGLGEARLELARSARPPTLLVRRGLRPSGVAPRESVTRFTWSLGPA